MGRISQLKRELIEEANKRILTESMGEEPIKMIRSNEETGADENLNYIFFFPEGEGKHPEAVADREKGDWISPFDDGDRNEIVNRVSAELRSSLPTIFHFVGGEFEDQLEGIIDLSSQTSASGSEKGNTRVGKERLDYVNGIVTQALDKLGVRDTKIQELLITYGGNEYRPSDIPDYLDPAKVNPLQMEQIATITIIPVKTEGLDVDSITKVKGKMDRSSGTFSSDEEGIVNAIQRLKTYSDIEDLNDRYVKAGVGNLESAINKAITDGLTVWGSDTQERRKIVGHLNHIAQRSGKSQVAKENVMNGNITIILDQ